MIIFLIAITFIWVLWTVSREDKSVVGCYIAGLVLAATWCYYFT